MKTMARFTVADIARATRAAKQQGAEVVEFLSDGTVRVVLSGGHKDEPKNNPTKTRWRKNTTDLRARVVDGESKR